MISIAIVDTSAESRNRIVEQVNQFLTEDLSHLGLLPRITIRPLSIQELKFSSTPDVCIIGEEVISHDLMEVVTIRKILPSSVLLARIDKSHDSLTYFEQLARVGVDDTISMSLTSAEFFRKIILLTRRFAKSKTGKLILIDSGKGGVGVTSVAGGMAEAILDTGRKVAVVDLDSESQDLSRFLQTRPFVNENLHLLLSQARPIVSETVEQCLVKVWADEDGLYCMPPTLESDELYDPRSPVTRLFVSILELLDGIFDCVVVDLGGNRGLFRKTLYRVADTLVFVVNNDPATLYASVDRITKARSVMGPTGQLLLVENASDKSGLSSRILRSELSKAAHVSPDSWLDSPIPLCREGGRWPGSSGTLYSQGRENVSRALSQLAARVGFAKAVDEKVGGRLSDIMKKVRNRSLGERTKEHLSSVNGDAILGQKGEDEKLLLPEPKKLIEAPNLNGSKAKVDASMTFSARGLVHPAEIKTESKKFHSNI